MRSALGLTLTAALAATAVASGQPPTRPAPAVQAPARPAATAPSPQAPLQPAAEPAPTEEALGVPVYPTAQYLRSYDAGHGQRYHLFGAQASFAEIVSYYRTILKQRGELVFERPATHMFEVGRYRAESMAFPPGVTVKDFTSSGSGGFPNPRPGARPERFPTVIQIVPVPPQGGR